MTTITSLSLCRLSQALQRKEVSAREATEAYLSVIAQKEPLIHAFLTKTETQALAAADAVDARRLRGERLLPLAGVPMGLKDNLCTKSVRTTCASRMLEDFIPPYNATVAELLSDSILLGKLNMDEFAMGSSTENSAFGLTRNPHDINRVSGGSSGGSAAAVAAGEVAFALGSDTGGSIRQPAAFCGVVGCKPTYGAVSRYGMVAFASSLDQIGPLTRDVQDTALVLDAIVRRDPRDSTSVDCKQASFFATVRNGIKGLRIGLIREMSSEHCSRAVKAAYALALRALQEAGAEILEFSMPTADYALPAYHILSAAEAASNLARFDGVRYGHRAEEYGDLTQMYRKSRSEGFGSEVKRRIMLGTYVLCEGNAEVYYNKARRTRRLICREFAEIFTKCDLILTPTVATVAYKMGEKSGDSVSMYKSDMFTVSASMAGLPAVSVPFGRNSADLPVAIQLIAPACCESTMLRAAFALECAAPKGRL